MRVRQRVARAHRLVFFISGLGRLDLKHIYMLYKCRWICKVRQSSRSKYLWTSMFGASDTLYPFYFQPSVSVLVMLQICSRPAVQCSSSIMQFYYLSYVCLYFIFDFTTVCIFAANT